MTRPSEDELIARYFAPLAGPAGLGLLDDAALLTPVAGRQIVVTKDALVAGVHFFADDPPASVARKALGVNLSDLAAKASRPIGFLLALALPPDWTAEWLEGFAKGLGEDAIRYDCPLLGGDTVSTPGPWTISITALGDVAAGTMLPRTGARPGDRIYLSGTIGDAALGLRLRLAEPRSEAWIDGLSAEGRTHLLDRYLHPQPRLALRNALRFANAGMDISDGFVGDVSKLLRASGVSGRIELDRVPLSEAACAVVGLDPDALAIAVTGGDDYEIIATVAPDRAADFEADAAQADVRVTVVGEVLAGAAQPLFVDARGAARAFARGSYSHG